MQASVASRDTEITPPSTAFEIAEHKCRLQWCVSAGLGLSLVLVLVLALALVLGLVQDLG